MNSFVSQVAYPALSNAIDIKDEPERGRFGVSKITGTSITNYTFNSCVSDIKI